jgi:signal peptidase II
MVLFKKKKPIDYILYTAIILGGIIIDQLSKFLVSAFMEIGESIPLIKNFLHITYRTNPGMAFSLMSEPGKRWIFIAFSTIAIIGFALYLYFGHAENKLYAVSIGLVVSGGLGNMIDRIGIGFYTNPDGMGEVIDFIDFCGIWNAVFNVADSFVCVGAGLLILACVLDIIKEEKARKAASKESDDDSQSK